VSELRQRRSDGCELSKLDLTPAYQRAGGKTVTITSTVADLAGRPARTFGEFVRDYGVVFRGEHAVMRP